MTVRESDAILREEIAKAGLDRDVWQYFTVNRCTPVGVMAMTQSVITPLPSALSLLSTVRQRLCQTSMGSSPKDFRPIVNEVDHVATVYDITSKPPATVRE